MSKKFIHALGIMSGTSIDAVDYSLIRVHKNTLKPEFLAHAQRALPKAMKTKILQAASNQMTTFDLSHLHFDLGRLYSKHVTALSKKWNWDVIGLHGQTVHHAGGKASLQLGTPSFLQISNPTPVISDFRAMDVADGGQGAPFAPFFQKKLVGSPRRPVAFHNLGGISNLTWIHKNDVIAFDTGPANILLDGQISMMTKGKTQFDKGGQRAARGLPEMGCVAQFLTHRFFNKKRPKSCGREEFNLSFIKKYGSQKFQKLSPEDQLATLTEVTARSIAGAYKKKFLPQPPKTIYFYGGGVYNTYLMSRIRFNLAGIEVRQTEDLGWPTQALEASVFGFLGAARLLQKPVHLPKVTGAQSLRHLGQVHG